MKTLDVQFNIHLFNITTKRKDFRVNIMTIKIQMYMILSINSDQCTDFKGFSKSNLIKLWCMFKHNCKTTNLLYMINLVVFTFLIACDFAICSITKVSHHDWHVFDFAVRVLQLVTQIQPFNLHPLIQTAVNCQQNSSFNPLLQNYEHVFILWLYIKKWFCKMKELSALECNIPYMKISKSCLNFI